MTITTMQPLSRLGMLVLIACAKWCSSYAICNTNHSIFSSTGIIVNYTNHTTPDSPKSPLCTWLLSTTPPTTRIVVEITNFGTASRDSLLVGNGHNFTDDDSIFVKIKGVEPALTIVSSGNHLWMKYSMSKNGTTKERFQVKLDSFHEEETLIQQINSQNITPLRKVSEGTEIPGKKSEPALECLPTCQCLLMDNQLEVQCIQNWTIDVISRLPSFLSHLTLSQGTMTSLEERQFSRLQHLQSLSLLRNNITRIENNTFNGLTHLKLLNLSSNHIDELQSYAFNGLPQLNHLDIRVNKLTEWHPDRLKVLPSLQKLYLHNNQQAELSTGLCDYFLQNAIALRLDGNSLSEIPPGIFKGCHMIITLKMSRNEITHLQNGSFQGLTEMVSLELSRNKIEWIDQGAFKDLSHLIILRLKENNLVSFREHAFVGLSHLILLDLRNNPWVDIESYAFWGMPNLTFLFLQRKEDIDQVNGKITLKSLDGLNSLQDMFVDDYRLCCLKPKVCSPQTEPPLFHTCKRLMPNTVLQTMLWLLGISAMTGNLYVILFRCQEKHVRNPTQAMLIQNLALSDLIMGFYMLIIAGADIHFGEEFFISAEIWKSSDVCMFAGFLSLFSSEASVFFVVLISVDRLLCVALPFGKKRMTVLLAKVSCTAVWITVAAIGITAAALQIADTDAYALATVCVGIPLVSTKSFRKNKVYSPSLAGGGVLHKVVAVTEGTSSTWQFAIAIYLGINFIAFVIVFACYAAIGAIVVSKLPSKQLQRKKDRRREMKMTGKMALIVFTDFCCWLPVIILGILIQSGAVEAVPIETYAWIVALVLPLNSALNPYIYTISTELTKRKRKKQDKREEFNLRRTAMPSQTVPSQSKTSRYTNL